MEFNDVLSQFDLFTEVVTQRSEHGTGVWLSGLDVLAADALRVDVAGYEPASAICYLARGPGAAIRRAHTRLPGGGANPVAIIRVPRERMVGSGIASSLVHEVGHQGAAQLGLVETLRGDLARARAAEPDGVWDTFDRWLSEIVADCWSVGKLGLTSTVGLLAVVSLPPYFVFRPSGEDPHPTPYLRVLISASIGQALYPDPQWAAMRRTWKRLYPVDGLPADRRAELERIERGILAFVRLLLNHRSGQLDGRRLGDLWPVRERHPQRLTCPAPALGRRPGRDGPAAAVTGVRGDRSGEVRRADRSGDGELDALRPAHRLGGAQHARRRPALARRPGVKPITDLPTERTPPCRSRGPRIRSGPASWPGCASS